MSGFFQDDVKLALSASDGADIVSRTPPHSFTEICSVAFSAVLRRNFLDLFHCGDYLCSDFY